MWSISRCGLSWQHTGSVDASMLSDALRLAAVAGTEFAQRPCVPRGNSLSLLQAKARTVRASGEKVVRNSPEPSRGSFWQNETKYDQPFLSALRWYNNNLRKYLFQYHSLNTPLNLIRQHRPNSAQCRGASVAWSLRYARACSHRRRRSGAAPPA